MREILFRAKRVDNEEWMEGSLITLDADRGYYFIVEPYFSASTLPIRDLIYDHTHLVFPETICQYTGLTDKNGNKIWENDVVRSTIITERKAKVVYGDFNCKCCHGLYGWTFEPIGGYSEICDIRETETIEVIGNIFDNPELMERMG